MPYQWLIFIRFHCIQWIFAPAQAHGIEEFVKMRWIEYYTETKRRFFWSHIVMKSIYQRIGCVVESDCGTLVIPSKCHIRPHERWMKKCLLEQFGAKGRVGERMPSWCATWSDCWMAPASSVFAVPILLPPTDFDRLTVLRSVARFSCSSSRWLVQSQFSAK